MFKNTTMIGAVVFESASRAGADWHFKYQPANGGPVVSKRLLHYGPDWVELDLEDGEATSFFVHQRQMAWAMVDWDCEDMPPYTGKSTI